MLAYLFMIAGRLILLLFMAYPFFLGIYLSLTDKLVGFAEFDFVGLENYRCCWTITIFRQTVANTFIYGFVTVPFKLLLGLGLALVLNQTFHFSRFFRAGLLLPWIVPTAISSLAWLMLFDGVLSPISWVLKDWGIDRAGTSISSATPGTRIASLCVANIWRGIPFFAVSILAGLQAVPPELHEAAALDGAGAWQRFFSVTLPVIRNIILITTLFSIIWTFCRLPADLRADQGRSGQLDPRLRHLRLADRWASGDSARRRRSRSTCSRSWRSSPPSCSATCREGGLGATSHGRQQHLVAARCWGSAHAAALYAIFLLFPFAWMLIVSVKPDQELLDTELNPFVHRRSVDPRPLPLPLRGDRIPALDMEHLRGHGRRDRCSRSSAAS